MSWPSSAAGLTLTWRATSVAHLEMPLGDCDIFEFSNENIFVRIQENVRSRDVFLIQSLCSPVNTSVMELLIMIDAFRRASAGRITAVMPYYAYGRSDKKDQPRVPITARLLANLIETAGADRVLTIDLHAGQIQGFFNIPVDELTAISHIADYFNQRDLPDLTVLATDVGGEKRARNVARMLGTPLAIVSKERIGNEERVAAQTLIGDVRRPRRPDRRRRDRHGRHDHVGGGHRAGSTAPEASRVACIHPILSGNAVQRHLRQRHHRGAGGHRHDPAAAGEAAPEDHRALDRAAAGRGDHAHQQRTLGRRVVLVKD